MKWIRTKINCSEPIEASTAAPTHTMTQSIPQVRSRATYIVMERVKDPPECYASTNCFQLSDERERTTNKLQQTIPNLRPPGIGTLTSLLVLLVIPTIFIPEVSLKSPRPPVPAHTQVNERPKFKTTMLLLSVRRPSLKSTTTSTSGHGGLQMELTQTSDHEPPKNQESFTSSLLENLNSASQDHYEHHQNPSPPQAFWRSCSWLDTASLFSWKLLPSPRSAPHGPHAHEAPSLLL